MQEPAGIESAASILASHSTDLPRPANAENERGDQ